MFLEKSSGFGPFYWQQIRNLLVEKGYQLNESADTFFIPENTTQSDAAKKDSITTAEELLDEHSDLEARIAELERICREERFFTVKDI